MISKKITVNKTSKELDIHIDHSIEKRKVTMIGIWLALWTICGFVIIVSLVMPAPKETKMMMLVFLTFWLYFEATVYSTFIWKRKGFEQLTIKNGTLEIRVGGMKEKNYTIQVDKIKELILAPDNKFRNSMNNSFWNIGEPAVFVKTDERSVGFGRQLDKEEAIKIEKLIRPFAR